MAFGDPPPQWWRPEQTADTPAALVGEGPADQWFAQMEENVLLTVQAIQRLHLALHTRMP